MPWGFIVAGVISSCGCVSRQIHLYNTDNPKLLQNDILFLFYLKARRIPINTANNRKWTKNKRHAHNNVNPEEKICQSFNLTPLRQQLGCDDVTELAFHPEADWRCTHPAWFHHQCFASESDEASTQRGHLDLQRQYSLTKLQSKRRGKKKLTILGQSRPQLYTPLARRMLGMHLGEMRNHL